MPDSPELLASDSERERAAESLRAHAADGRLDHDELEERLGRAYGARTRGELAPLLADLPVPAQPEPRRLPQISPLIAISVMLIVIWAVSGMGYFWPMWPIGAMALGGLKHRGRCMPASRYLRTP